MTDDDGADREFLVDLESQSIKAFPERTSFGELSADGTQALLSMANGFKTWPQVIVQIPPVS